MVRGISGQRIHAMEIFSEALPIAPTIWQAADTEPAQILVVDEDNLSRQMLCSHLQQHGYLCVGVAREQAAMQQLTTSSFDLVLIALELSGRNGMQVAHQAH